MDISYRDELATIHYDMYKDVHGIRPRWYNYAEMTVEDLKAELDRLDHQMEQVLEERKKEEKESEQAFKSTLAVCMKAGAKDEREALRWIIQEESLEHEQDIDHFLYNLGLLFTSYGSELKKDIKQLVNYK